MVGEGDGGGGGGGGGVKNIMAIINDPPPNCRIQDVTSLALFVHLSGLFITLWLVKEAAVVVVVGGGQNIE